MGELDSLKNELGDTRAELNAIRSANENVKEVLSKLKSSRGKIETIWMDIKNYDADKLKDSWIDQIGSETYTTKFLETERYVNNILTKLDSYIDMLKTKSNELEDRSGRSSEYIAYLQDRMGDLEASK
jgi:prefoldin subunit 5